MSYVEGNHESDSVRGDRAETELRHRGSTGQEMLSEELGLQEFLVLLVLTEKLYFLHPCLCFHFLLLFSCRPSCGSKCSSPAPTMKLSRQPQSITLRRRHSSRPSTRPAWGPGLKSPSSKTSSPSAPEGVRGSRGSLSLHSSPPDPGLKAREPLIKHPGIYFRPHVSATHVHFVLAWFLKLLIAHHCHSSVDLSLVFCHRIDF